MNDRLERVQIGRQDEVLLDNNASRNILDKNTTGPDERISPL